MRRPQTGNGGTRKTVQRSTVNTDFTVRKGYRHHPSTQEKSTLVLSGSLGQCPKPASVSESPRTFPEDIRPCMCLPRPMDWNFCTRKGSVAGNRLPVCAHITATVCLHSPDCVRAENPMSKTKPNRRFFNNHSLSEFPHPQRIFSKSHSFTQQIFGVCLLWHIGGLAKKSNPQLLQSYHQHYNVSYTSRPLAFFLSFFLRVLFFN